MEENAKKVAELLKILANEHRLMLLCLLLEKPESVNHLTEKIGKITQPATSQHLALLKAHGIVSSEKNGLNNVYRIKDERIEEIINLIKKHYC